MEFKGNDHVYKVIPDLFGNHEAKEPAIFHLKGISQADYSKAVMDEALINRNHNRETAAKMVSENSIKLVADRVVNIENLVIDGMPITSFTELSAHAPRELVNWIVAAVHSTTFLMEYEIKN